MSTDAKRINNASVIQIEEEETGRKHVYLGQDKKGYHHHCIKHERAVIVIHENGTIAHKEDWSDVDDTMDAIVTRWIEYVESRRGWDSRKHITLTQFFGKGLQMGFRQLNDVLELNSNAEGRADD